MEITFKARPWRSGGSWVLTLPQQYVKDGYIDPEKELSVVVTNEEVSVDGKKQD